MTVPFLLPTYIHNLNSLPYLKGQGSRDYSIMINQVSHLHWECKNNSRSYFYVTATRTSISDEDNCFWSVQILNEYKETIFSDTALLVDIHCLPTLQDIMSRWAAVTVQDAIALTSNIVEYKES